MSEVSSVPSRPTSPASDGTPDMLPTARPYRFTWDPATRKPGPESVSNFTEGPGGDDFSGPHPLAFLNTSNTSLVLGSLPSEWSSSRTGFHAISTVLNNPHKRQAPPKAHSTLPSVPPAELPRVRRKDFESYLRAVAPEWERYEHNLELGREGLAQIDASQGTPRNSISLDEPPTPLPPLLQGKNIPPLDSVPSVFFRRDFNLGDPRTFADVTEQDLAASLMSPQDGSFEDPFSLSHSLPLLEKFSHYADTVEQHLVREIFIRSTSFFAALTNLRDLQSESERCLDRITKLRKELQDVDNNGAKRGLEMVRKESKMANLGKIRDGVKLVNEVVEMSGVAKNLVNAGQWGQALGVIEDLEKLWDANESSVPDTASLQSPPPTGLGGMPRLNGNGHPPGAHLRVLDEEDGEDITGQSPITPKGFNPPAPSKPHPPRPCVPLSSLHAFSSLPSHLRQLTMEIAASLSNELVSSLRNDLESRINSDGKPNPSAEQNLKDVLKPLLLNLVRTKGLKEGMLSWREVVFIAVRGVVKKIIPGFNAEEEEGDSQSDSKTAMITELRAMRHTEFVLLIQRVYRSLYNAVEGLQAQGNIIVEILTTLSSEMQQTVTNIPAVEEDLTDIVSTTAELSNMQAAKVISYRSEQHAALGLADFLTFFNDSWAFVIKCETISRRMIVGLRGTVVGQATLFLQTFHQARISQSAKLVEDEVWNPAEITPNLQHLTNVILASAVQDPPELIIQSDETIFSPHAATFPGAPNGTPTTTPSFGSAMQSALPTAMPSAVNGVVPPKIGATGHLNATTSTKHLHIEERSYYAVNATTEVLSLLLDYLRVVVNLSMLTTDTMHRVIEFLKAFNSRTCQVVLGAGAMRSAGLKNITARHLALASQSLSIVFELIPYVREAFRRHLSQKQAVMLVDFDKLKRDFQDHQNEIHAKLIAIMGDRLNAHVKALKAVDWNTSPPSGVNSYMEVLVKETVTLHKVLSRYLSANVVEYIMTQVFAAINHRLSEEYAAITLPNPEAKDRLLADAKYLHQKLAVLKNVGAPLGLLETVVMENRVGSNVEAEAQPAQPARSQPNPPTRSNTLSTNQRLRGLMTGRKPSFMSNSDQSLPQRTSSSTPPPPPPASDKPKSPILPPSQNLYVGTHAEIGSVSQLSLPDGNSSGFREVIARNSSDSQSRS